MIRKKEKNGEINNERNAKTKKERKRVKNPCASISNVMFREITEIYFEREIKTR